ncbi:uncharacterized protein A4U43_C04F19820 [Asparagus officinalis]|uniref:Peripheral subunit-binding (PSBD) domain-containing protein n=1 Tax=Asparagus officinalis TaxID=4686 RepID=A0A5P1F2A5_ASPOF|nr:uncharacterized protein A4U43_C04F19820 [Asparagus officinalis]
MLSQNVDPDFADPDGLQSGPKLLSDPGRRLGVPKAAGARVAVEPAAGVASEAESCSLESAMAMMVFLRSARDVVLCHERVVTVRNFSKAAGAFTGKADGSNLCGLHGKEAGEPFHGIGELPIMTETVKGGCRQEYFGIFKISHPGNSKCAFSRLSSKLSTPMTSMVSNSSLSCIQYATQRRSFSSNSDLPPHQEIGMPSLSPTMTEDKATVEMECMEEGYVAKIIQGDGAQNIKVGEIIAITVEEEDDIGKFKDYKASAPAAPAESKPSAEPTSSKKVEPEPPKAPEPKFSRPEAASSAGERIFSSPLARKLAEDNNVPLSSIKGTGPDGRILKADVEDYLASAATVPKVKDTATVQGLNYADIPISQIRKVTASRLLLSKQTIPHYYLTVDTRVDKLMELRNQLNSLQEASGGKRISVNDLVIKAAALALRKVPACNSSWMDDFIRQYNNVNVNVAVQTDNGLFVPVIKDADKKGLGTISEEVKQLAQKAKDNSLKPADYEGGTFTVSNLGGPFGIKQFCAIINPPQSGILAVGSAERRVIPGADPDQFDFGSFMSVTLSCDHRVIDGAVGAEWLKAFKGYIENPTSMLL